MAETNEINVPAKFPAIVRDFARDLTTTFPEYSILWKKWTVDDQPDREFEKLFKYCTEVYPERFFDILYQNEDIFGEESAVNTRFLPAIEFKLLYHCAGVTETTRSAIWKYLQLILMTVLNSVRDKSAFGDAANMFEGVDEKVLQEKLNHTLEEIGEFFRGLGDSGSGSESNGEEMPDFAKSFADGFSAENGGAFPKGMEGIHQMFEQMRSDASGNNEMPNAADLHEHLKGLFDGKIGSLAKELAEEITQDVEQLFDGDSKDIKSTGDLIKNMVKNPKKIMGLMKTISGKLQQKMKSGEISEEEIMKEAGDIMGKMKGMKGMGQMNDMFKNLAKGMGNLGGGGGAKGGINMAALQRMQKQMAAKERMLAKMEEKKAAKISDVKHIEKTDDPSRAVFRLDGSEKQEYSVKPPDLDQTSASSGGGALNDGALNGRALNDGALNGRALNDAELVAMFSDNKKPAKKSSGSSNKKKVKK